MGGIQELHRIQILSLNHCSILRDVGAKIEFFSEKEYKQILKIGFVFKMRLRSHLKISGSSERY
jgi:hypothetical protein